MKTNEVTFTALIENTSLVLHANAPILPHRMSMTGERVLRAAIYAKAGEVSMALSGSPEVRCPISIDFDYGHGTITLETDNRAEAKKLYHMFKAAKIV